MISTLTAYCFVDGGHLRAAARKHRRPLVDPRVLASNVAYSNLVQTWRKASTATNKAYGHREEIGLARVLYYDARPDQDDAKFGTIEEYWKAIELLPDTEIGFGAVRGRPRRQKKVDGLIAVDMMVGAFTGLFQVALLVAGDSDFVPVVNEVRRRGVMVVVAGVEEALSDELRRSADRIWPIVPTGNAMAEFPPLRVAGNVFYESEDGTVTLGKE